MLDNFGHMSRLQPTCRSFPAPLATIGPKTINFRLVGPDNALIVINGPVLVSFGKGKAIPNVPEPQERFLYLDCRFHSLAFQRSPDCICAYIQLLVLLKGFLDIYSGIKLT